MEGAQSAAVKLANNDTTPTQRLAIHDALRIGYPRPCAHRVFVLALSATIRQFAELSPAASTPSHPFMQGRALQSLPHNAEPRDLSFPEDRRTAAA
jgi:hypothetical protein